MTRKKEALAYNLVPRTSLKGKREVLGTRLFSKSPSKITPYRCHVFNQLHYFLSPELQKKKTKLRAASDKTHLQCLTHSCWKSLRMLAALRAAAVLLGKSTLATRVLKAPDLIARKRGLV